MKKRSASLAAMEARSVDGIPEGPEWQYEPKWDGFRCLLSREHDKVSVRSKSGQELSRYFPEIVSAARALCAKNFALDGEIVVPVDGQFSFDDLLQRIHPAASRVKKLAAETPALYLAFDLLKAGPDEVSAMPLSERRPKLEEFAGLQFASTTLFRLSPASRKQKDARGWLASAGGGSDDVIAKRLDLPYQSGNRDGMQKIKKYRSADCVIGGFRYAEKPMAGRKVIGSVLLGLYDEEGLLHHVGCNSAYGLTSDRRRKLTPPTIAQLLEPSPECSSRVGSMLEADGGQSSAHIYSHMPFRHRGDHSESTRTVTNAHGSG